MTNPAHRDALRALVEQWRAKAAVTDTFHATMGIGWKVCADELAAVLDRPTPPVDWEPAAAVAEAEELACRQKEHDGKSRHARSCWGASAVTAGLIANRIRGLADRPAPEPDLVALLPPADGQP